MKDILDHLKAVDRQSPIPFYIQIKQTLQDYIEQGRLQPGDKLPNEFDLCQAFNTSRIVIRQCLKEMEYAGLVRRERGKGTYVTKPKIKRMLTERFSGLHQDMANQGYAVTSKILSQKVIKAPVHIAKSLEIPPQKPLVRIERLRFIQGEAMVINRAYLIYDQCPDILTADLSNISLHEILDTKYNIQPISARQSIEACPANEKEAKMLNIKKNTPLILLENIWYANDDTPFEYIESLFRADRMRFEIELISIKPREIKPFNYK